MVMGSHTASTTTRYDLEYLTSKHLWWAATRPGYTWTQHLAVVAIHAASSRPSLASVGKKPSLSARLSSGVDHLQRASLGASLDVLKEGCETADEFEAAAVSLHNLLTDLEEDPEAPVHRRKFGCWVLCLRAST